MTYEIDECTVRVLQEQLPHGVGPENLHDRPRHVRTLILTTYCGSRSGQVGRCTNKNEVSTEFKTTMRVALTTCARRKKA